MNALCILFLAATLSSLTCNGTYGESIINGKTAKKNTLKFMASVQAGEKHICGGFLIHPGYVLTAAHCERDNMTVVLGTTNISPTGTNLQRYLVGEKHKYPSYESAKNGGDIMLLKLSKNNPKNKAMKTIKIPSSDKPIKPNTKCQVAGWGKTETQNKVNDLMVADVPIIDLKTCQMKWNEIMSSFPTNVLCAGGYRTKSGACQGDSGGPLVCNGVAVGIVSFNLYKHCNYPNVPNVYTDVSKYRNWIKKIIGKRV